MRGRHLYRQPSEQAIVLLKEELDSARRTILDLMPERIQKLLSSYTSCTSSEEAWGWKTRVTDSLIEIAEVLPNDAPRYLPDTAYCPLCRAGSSAPFAKGFTIPEGLRRHLVGWGNVHQCKVMAAAIGLANEYWRYQFEEKDALEAARKSALTEHRKQTETLYLLGPKEQPTLIDKIFRGNARTPEELAWAEQRLSRLGFEIKIEDRIKSYRHLGKDFAVYADPRVRGRISFRVYRLPSTNRSIRGYQQFYLLDSWKHEIEAKYRARLAASVKLLSK